MAKSKETSSGSIGILGLLGVAFVVLKLTGVIDWSWWWVTVPFWGMLAVALVAWAILVLIGGAIALLERK